MLSTRRLPTLSITLTFISGLDDLTVRFLLNLPKSELSSVPRLCFQVEEAHWYYEDFIRPLAAAAGNQLPNLPLRQFCLLLFQHCPLLSGFSDDEHVAAYEEFLAYKVRVPVRGAILLDESMEQVLLVRGWKKGSSWSFPRGKINKDEPDLDCAIREVWEETGYDVRTAGLIPENEVNVKHIDIVMREQHMRLFVFRNVPLDTVFETQTRKEISKIQWYNLRALPGFSKKSRQDVETGNANKYYMVAPFLGPLKKWITLQRKNDAAMSPNKGLTESEVEQSDPATVVDRSIELRRMLSIGTPQRDPPSPRIQALSQSQALPQSEDTQANKLLAMLQGAQPELSTAPPPLARLEQIVKQPAYLRSPQPPYTRYPQAPPQFPVSPQPLQHAWNQFNPASQINRGHNGHLHQQHMHQQYHASQRFSPQQPLSHTMNIERQQVHPLQQFAQGPGAIAAGPAVPSASQLPLPKLNLHAMALLDAFKSDSAGPAVSAIPAERADPTPKLQNPHQTALLGLFKHTAVVPSPTADGSEVSDRSAALSPTLSDVTVKPPKEQARTSTLNEITRTLPRMKRPSQVTPPANTAGSTVLPLANTAAPIVSPAAPQQSTMGQHLERAPNIPSSTGVNKSSNASLRTRPNGVRPEQVSPPFKILTRPDSTKDQPRTDGTGLPAADASAGLSVNTSDGKTPERLLALFSKPAPARSAPTTSETIPALTRPVPTTSETTPADANKAALLGLFNASTLPPKVMHRPQPPRAPSLQPSSGASRTTSQPPAPIHTGHQNPLLELFRKGSPSVETPISPFVLGSPEQARHAAIPSRSRFADEQSKYRLGSTDEKSRSGLGSTDEKLRSRLGSVASSGRATPTATTPEEAKDFLLEYLNGVVLKEGLGRK